MYMCKMGNEDYTCKKVKNLTCVNIIFQNTHVKIK